MSSRSLKAVGALTVALATAVALVPSSAQAATRRALSEQQELVNRARATFARFRGDPGLTGFREHERDALAFLIIPKAVRVGLIFGGSGGPGVVVARNGRSWNGPSFYSIGTASFGLQAGVDVSEIIVAVMTQRGVNALLSGSTRLGVDASVAAGPAGIGAGRAPRPTADFVYYSRAKGLYGGATLEGAVIRPNYEWNEAYYRGPASPSEILIAGSLRSTGSRRLLATVETSPRVAVVRRYRS
jgi:SH3 domain-containing YSC84-like protein 1